MASSYIQGRFAGRIGGAKFGKSTKIYKFEKIKRAKAAAQQAHPGVELLDFGVGEPDDMAFPGVVEALRREAARWENRGYADNGIAEFKEAAARYLDRVFGAPGIDPETEVIHSIGAKPALAMLPAAFINPGDVALVTVPGYPVLATHTRWYGGRVAELPLTQERGYLPDLSAIKAADLKRAKLLYLNYPNNPTGASATREFFEEVVRFAKRRKLIVVVDAAYAALIYGGPPLSFLSIPGAKDVGVELHSLSKAYNMTGWRLGFVAGNPLIVSAFGDGQGQLRLGPVQGHPARGRVRAGAPRDHRGDREEVRAPVAADDRGARRRRLRRGDAARLVFSLYPRVESDQGRAEVQVRGGGLRVSDHREADLHRAVGRRGPVPPLLRDLPGEGSGG